MRIRVDISVGVNDPPYTYAQTTEMERRYRRAQRGQRVWEGTAAGHWRTLTLPGALTAMHIPRSNLFKQVEVKGLASTWLGAWI